MIDKITAAYLLIINILAFITYGVDKFKAIQDKWRIPEATLIGLAVIGGSIGAIFGMHVFHHKTKKPKFFIGLPVIIAMQVVLVGYVYYHYH